jgi:hypothetical protein
MYSVVVSKVPDGVRAFVIHIVIYVALPFEDYTSIGKENKCKEGGID